MQDLKNKLYNYETPPPERAWQSIIEELDNEKVIKLYSRKKSRFLFYGVTAAASIVIIFLGSLIFQKDRAGQDKNITRNNTIEQKIKDSALLNQQILKSIINNPEEKKEIVSQSSTPTKRYLTVAGPEGQPVKISPKVATLIISADNEYPPKPVWSKKINKWQKIMLSTTISPSPTNLMDLLQLAANSDNVE
jgi:hypothetical protein